jgi:hypothetical protein
VTSAQTTGSRRMLLLQQLLLLLLLLPDKEGRQLGWGSFWREVVFSSLTPTPRLECGISAVYSLQFTLGRQVGADGWANGMFSPSPISVNLTARWRGRWDAGRVGA